MILGGVGASLQNCSLLMGKCHPAILFLLSFELV